MSKSKRIKDAAKELERALKKHVDVVTDSAVSMKKAQRAGARLASAAQVYAEAVAAKTGLDNPFITGGGKLDDQATRSLLAERDGIAKSLTGSVPALPDLPTEVDLSPAEFHALETTALETGGPDGGPGLGATEDVPTADFPLDDAVEDWEDDSIEVDDDEDEPAQDADAQPVADQDTPHQDALDDAGPSETEPGVDQAEPVEPDVEAPSITDAPVVVAEPVEQWVGDAAPERDDLGGDDIFANIVAIATSSTEGSEPSPDAASETPEDESAGEDYRGRHAADGEPDQPPALPEQEPSSEEEKPYSEDI